MYKFFISLKKEVLLFWNDKVGMLLMFVLPVLLVFIITIIQDSAFKIIDNKQIKLLIVNDDKGTMGSELINELSKTGMFEVIIGNHLSAGDVSQWIRDKKALAGLYVPPGFSKNIKLKSDEIGNKFLAEFHLGTDEKAATVSKNIVRFYHDPVLQENYSYSLVSIIRAQIKAIETKSVVTSLYDQMGEKGGSGKILDEMADNSTDIEQISAVEKLTKHLPNSAQHNVPAWTIFAIFFMVVSLGSNVVKEKLSGSFVRIKTTPTGFWKILISKQIIYIVISIIQVFTIFGLAITVFPIIHLPALFLPANVIATIIFVLLCGFAAVSYAMMIGTLSKTIEQANGVGAISIVIFAALGGIWVPTFMMPGYMQVISLFSPLHWCLDGFYTLFLKNGDGMELLLPSVVLICFSLICQSLAYLKWRKI